MDGFDKQIIMSESEGVNFASVYYSVNGRIKHTTVDLLNEEYVNIIKKNIQSIPGFDGWLHSDPPTLKDIYVKFMEIDLK